MASSTELKEISLEQQVPLTTQPKKQVSAEDAASAPTKLRYKPVQVVCPRCSSHVTTDLAYHITDFTHLSVFLCSVATWPCGMCFLSGIPYCLKVCQKVEHLCPQCKGVIGKHSQFRLSNLCNKKPTKE